MAMPGRKFTASAEYRYGFNGKENDKDISEGGQDYGMRIYDSRLGRFFTTDPLDEEYPELTPYQFTNNSPITFIDRDGEEQAFRMPDGTTYIHPPSDHLRLPIPNQVQKNGKAITYGRGDDLNAMSTTLDFIPVVGTIKGVIEGIAGYDMAGNKLSAGERFLGVLPVVGKIKKITTVVKAGDKIAETEKAATKIVKNKKAVESSEKAIVKNSDAIAEGKKSEKDELANSLSEGKNATGNNRLVPQNGKGNVKGNRTNTDQLIKNEDGTYDIVETKLSEKTSLTKGQKAAKKHIEQGDGIFEIRTNQPSLGLKKGDKIKVNNYIRKNKNG